MSNETSNVETNVETLDINIDEIFDGAPSAEGITVPEQKNNIFQQPEQTADFSFTEPTKETTDETTAETVETTQTTDRDWETYYSSAQER